MSPRSRAAAAKAAYEADASVSFGNACEIEVASERGGAVVSFAPDPKGGPECLWFSLGIRRVRPGRGARGETLKLVLRNLGNVLGGSDAAALRPVFRSDGGDWERSEPGRALRLPDGRTDVAWTLAAPRRRLDFALCYPYGRGDERSLVAGAEGFYSADSIGVSQSARPLVRLASSYGEEKSQRPGLYLIARQHSGETPGSWVLDGLLMRLAELCRGPGGRPPVVWAAPLANIDGVEQGFYGKDNFPYDLNRAWGSPPMRHETLVIQRDMRRWAARCKPFAAIDFHAPGGCETDGMYAFCVSRREVPAALRRASAQLASRVGRALGGYASGKFRRTADYKSRWETPGFAAFAASALRVRAFTIETPYALCGSILMTRERYREAGARIAEALAAAMPGVCSRPVHPRS